MSGRNILGIVQLVRFLLVSTCVVGAGCAHRADVPVTHMSRAAQELHLAHQAGASHDPDSRTLWLEAEAALEEARRDAFRGRNLEAQSAATRCTDLALRARELAEVKGLGYPTEPERGEAVGAEAELAASAEAQGSGAEPTSSSTATASMAWNGLSALR